MIKIYLDNCCYCRPFDNLSQEKVGLEASAIEMILKRHEIGQISIYGSLAIDYEISRIKLDSKRRQVEDLYDAVDSIDLLYTVTVREKADELKRYNIKDMDALHIAFAEVYGLDYFITTDKVLNNAAKRANLNVKVMNPVEFVMEVI